MAVSPAVGTSRSQRITEATIAEATLKPHLKQPSTVADPRARAIVVAPERS
jgi:hypothetical protein